MGQQEQTTHLAIDLESAQEIRQILGKQPHDEVQKAIAAMGRGIGITIKPSVPVPDEPVPGAEEPSE